MTLNAAKVLVGTADQTSTTGAVRNGTEITTIPSTFSAAQTAVNALTGSGYVSEDGVSISTDYSVNDIKEWNGAVVRKVLESFTGEISWSMIQFDEQSWIQALGSSYVSKTAATTTTGEQLVIKMGNHLGPVQAWGFALKDGNAKAFILVPRGQITAIDEITFNATEAASIPVTLSCYDDGTGNSIYIYTDDGVVTSG